MKLKGLFIILLIILCACIFFGCNNYSFEKLNIECEDVNDIPEGEYTLIYSIKDYEEFAQKYDLTIKVKVFDQDNNEVEVKNNRTITVQKDYEYTVIVYCSTIIKEEATTKQRQFSVKAEKSPPSVNFVLKYNTITQNYKTIAVDYMGSLSIDEVPNLPDWYADYKEGIQKSITSKKWVIIEDGKEVDLDQAHLNNITSQVTVYGIYEYSIVYVKLSIKFNSNGGSVVSDISGTLHQTINRPNNPTKEGATFDGWYTDSELETPYNWKEQTVFAKTMTLYAKWLEVVGNHIDLEKLNYQKATDDYGNDYYSITAKEEAAIPTLLVLPNGYENIPIKKIGDNAFQGKNIISLYIPSSITIISASAFLGCGELTNVTFESGNKMQALGWSAFKNCAKLNTITNLPDTLTDLGKETFYGCAALTSFIIPTGVDSLKEGVFRNCTSLNSIIIPDAVVEILTNAFNGCTSLSSVTINKASKLQAISLGAFTNTAITEITLPYYFVGKTNPFDGTSITVSYHEEVISEEE